MKAAPLAWMVAAALAPAPAAACMTTAGERSVIHSALPNPLPPDTIVAEVDIVTPDETAIYRAGVVARVLRPIQGEIPGNVLVLRWPSFSVCDRPFTNGRRGYVIAVVRAPAGSGPADDQSGLFAEPYPAVRAAHFRLQDGEEISQEWRRPPPGW